MDGLTIGRNVHYVLKGNEWEILPEFENPIGRHRLAFVIDVLDIEVGAVWLRVLCSPRDGFVAGGKYVIELLISANYSDAKEPGTWHWPEYVK